MHAWEERERTAFARSLLFVEALIQGIANITDGPDCRWYHTTPPGGRHECGMPTTKGRNRCRRRVRHEGDSCYLHRHFHRRRIAA